MGRRKVNKQRRVRPQQMTSDRADPYEDRNRRALCRVCGGDLIRAERIRRDAAPETLIKHLDSDRDHEHDADLVWVWDEVQCDFCGGRGVVWSYQVAPLAAPRPAWLSPAGELLDTHGAVNQTPWTACGGCADLIEAENWDGLVQAFLDRHQEETGDLISPTDAASIRATQHQFVAMRTGARVPYGDIAA